MTRTILTTSLFLLSAYTAAGQDRTALREGARLYRAGKWAEAAEAFKRAAEAGGADAAYNLGAALYSAGQYEASRAASEAAAKSAATPTARGAAHHNRGNAFAAEEKWKDAAEAYKAALREAPDARDTRYNLSYALAKLKQQGEQQKQNQKDQRQDQQEKNNQQNGEPKNNQDQQQPQEKKPQQKNGQSSPMPRQQADAVLDALRQREGQVRDRLQKASATPVTTDKDW